MTVTPFLNETLQVTFADGSAIEAPVVSLEETPEGTNVVVGHAGEYKFNTLSDYLADGLWFRIDESTGAQWTFAQISLDPEVIT